MLAAANGHLCRVDRLINMGIDVNSLGVGKALQAATYAGHDAVADMLFQGSAFIK